MKFISKTKLEEMFEAYRTKQTFQYVSDTCHICRATVRKYHKSERWDERLGEIIQAVAKRVDKKDVDHKVRHVEVGKFMQAKGLEGLKVARGKDITPKVAATLLKEGVAIEREALGDHTPNIVIKLELPAELVL